MSLLAYIFPLDFSMPLKTGSEWTYFYSETISSKGQKIYEFKAHWKYLITKTEDDLLYLEINETSKFRYRLENGSWREGETKEKLFSLVNAKTRVSGYMFFCSWWIPSNLRYGDLVPIWDLKFRVIGLTWLIIGGNILECWILKNIDYSPNEEYIFYYERTTGFFVHYQITYSYGGLTKVIRRTLLDTGMAWPLLTVIRPYLIIIILVACSLLLTPHIYHLVIWLKELKGRRIFHKQESLLF
ncbi:TPA: hypothetical protein EYP70_06545 [Candidatus Bathyarchaeota archaeon]|nr:hypothetical protein [Candidatus Bathyarchaeota archaeon]